MRSRVWLVLALMSGLACDDGGPSVDASSPDAPAVPDAPAAPDAPVVLDAAPPDATPPDAAPDDAAGPVVLTSTASIAPALGSLCGVGYDAVAAQLWVYACSNASVHGFTTAGVAAGTLARPGESANDVDVAFAPVALTLGVNAVAAGDMLFINGETGVVEIHLPETAASTPLASVFGGSHVVGGAYHVARATLFVVQDNVAATDANTIAELDRTTGAVLGSFSIAADFSVSFGDLDVCQSSGHLFVVSSIQTTVAEYLPDGTLLAKHPLPAAVTAPSGLAIVGAGEAWVASTGGGVFRVEGLPCP